MPSPVCHMGPAAFEDTHNEITENVSLIPDNVSNARLSSLSSSSSRSETPALKNDDASVNSNPFWNDNSASIELQSSFGNSPFDTAIFTSQKASPSVSSVAKPTSSCTSPALTSPLVRIPPPPVSSSRSSQRSRCRSSSSDKSTFGKSAAKKLQHEFDTEFTEFETDIVLQSQPTQSESLFHIDDIAPLDKESNKNIPIKPESHHEASQSLPENFFDTLFQESVVTDETQSKFVEEANKTNISQQSCENDNLVAVVGGISDDINFSVFEMNPTTTIDDIKNTSDNSTLHEEDKGDGDFIFQAKEKLLSPGDNEFDKLLQLTKNMSVESPNNTPVDVKNYIPALLPGVQLIENETGWPTYMRFPREKRTMSTRKWVEIFVRINTEKVRQ